MVCVRGTLDVGQLGTVVRDEGPACRPSLFAKVPFLAEVISHAREKRSSKLRAGSLPPGSLFPTHLRRRVLWMNKKKMF